MTLKQIIAIVLILAMVACDGSPIAYLGKEKPTKSLQSSVKTLPEIDFDDEEGLPPVDHQVTENTLTGYIDQKLEAKSCRLLQIDPKSMQEQVIIKKQLVDNKCTIPTKDHIRWGILAYHSEKGLVSEVLIPNVSPIMEITAPLASTKETLKARVYRSTIDKLQQKISSGSVSFKNISNRLLIDGSYIFNRSYDNELEALKDKKKFELIVDELASQRYEYLSGLIRGGFEKEDFEKLLKIMNSEDVNLTRAISKIGGKVPLGSLDGQTSLREQTIDRLRKSLSPKKGAVFMSSYMDRALAESEKMNAEVESLLGSFDNSLEELDSQYTSSPNSDGSDAQDLEEARARYLAGKLINQINPQTQQKLEQITNKYRNLTFPVIHQGNAYTPQLVLDLFDNPNFCNFEVCQEAFDILKNEAAQLPKCKKEDLSCALKLAKFRTRTINTWYDVVIYGFDVSGLQSERDAMIKKRKCFQESVDVRLTRVKRQELSKCMTAPITTKASLISSKITTMDAVALGSWTAGLGYALYSSGAAASAGTAISGALSGVGGIGGAVSGAASWIGSGFTAAGTAISSAASSVISALSTTCLGIPIWGWIILVLLIVWWWLSSKKKEKKKDEKKEEYSKQIDNWQNPDQPSTEGAIQNISGKSAGGHTSPTSITGGSGAGVTTGGSTVPTIAGSSGSGTPGSSTSQYSTTKTTGSTTTDGNKIGTTTPQSTNDKTEKDSESQSDSADGSASGEDGEDGEEEYVTRKTGGCQIRLP